jgi:hypothetical protein
MRRMLGVGLAAVGVLVLTMSVTASAAKPEINHFSFTGLNEEASADLTEFCGFPITVFEDTRATERTYPDGTLRDTVHQRITYTAGSQQLFERNSFQFFFDPGQNIERYTGVPFRIQDESGRVIFKDRGNVAFNAETGEVVWDHGKHPSLSGPAGGICRDLSS